MTYPQPSQGTYFKQNQAYIAIGHEAIRLLHSDTIGLAELLKEITSFYRVNNFDKDVKKKHKDTTCLLQNCVPGLADKSEFNWRLLWIGTLERHLYRLPQPIYDLYKTGFIDNSFWINDVSNIPRNIWQVAGILDEIISLHSEYATLKDRIAELKSQNVTTATARILKPTTVDSAETAKKHIEKKNIALFIEQEEARYSLRETRPNQRRFAEQVALRYDLKCAVCDITHRALLQAAHIIPKSANGSDEPENGLILCATHHLAFDNGLLRIDPESFDVTSTIFMHATHDSIAHLSKKPSIEALQSHDEQSYKRALA